MLSTDLLATWLHQQGKRVLLAAMGARSPSFSWKDEPAAPPYAEAYGLAVSLPQLLQRLRAEPRPSDWTEQLLAEDVVFERVTGFSRKVRDFELSEAERRVLRGHRRPRCPARGISEQAGLTLNEASQLLYRLTEVELIRVREGATATSLGGVLVIDPDTESFANPLGALLKERSTDLELVAVLQGESTYAAIYESARAW